MARWAAAWCLGHKAVHTCIPGFKDVQQLEGIFAGIDLVPDLHSIAFRE